MLMNDEVGQSDPTMVPIAEMHRRIRAVLATARSLTRRTARSAKSVEEFEQHLDTRLLAFGRSQSNATGETRSQVDLELLVREEVLAVIGRDDRFIHIAGPNVRLPRRLAETFTLAVNELLINSIKYGVLLTERGRISISWTIDRLAGGDLLEFSWVETIFGDAVLPPAHRGFGTELLEGVMRYEHDAMPAFLVGANGVRYSVKLLLAEVEGPVRW